MKGCIRTASSAAIWSLLTLLARTRRGHRPARSGCAPRAAGKVLRAARPGEPGELFGLGQFGRFVEERDQPLGIDPGRSLGGIEFGAGDGVEGPRLQRVELQLRIGPAALADRGEDARIARLLIGIEQRGDGGRGLWRAVARASAAGSSGAAKAVPVPAASKAPMVAVRAIAWPSFMRACPP
jgi:hypothetical protein